MESDFISHALRYEIIVSGILPEASTKFDIPLSMAEFLDKKWKKYPKVIRMTSENTIPRILKYGKIILI